MDLPTLQHDTMLSFTIAILITTIALLCADRRLNLKGAFWIGFTCGIWTAFATFLFGAPWLFNYLFN